MSGDEDDGSATARSREPLSEFDASHGTELDVEHQAAELGLPSFLFFPLLGPARSNQLICRKSSLDETDPSTGFSQGIPEEVLDDGIELRGWDRFF
jgi:hypothetical protein